jgi:hypothetical protein
VGGLVVAGRLDTVLSPELADNVNWDKNWRQRCSLFAFLRFGIASWIITLDNRYGSN